MSLILINIFVILLLIWANFNSISYFIGYIIGDNKKKMDNKTNINKHNNGGKLKDTGFKNIIKNGIKKIKAFFKIDSLNKVAFLLVLLIIDVLFLIPLNKIWLFVLEEIGIFLIFYILLNNLNKTFELFKLIYGQLYFTFMAIYAYLLFWQNDIKDFDFNNYIFLIVVTILICMLTVSITLYYRAKNKLYKRLHFVFCVSNILVLLILILSYMGYGFMYYNLKESKIESHKAKLNVKGQINVINMFPIFVSYALDNLTAKVNVKIGNSNIHETISTAKIYFVLMCRAFITTYIALVFAFVSNSLFSRGGKNKN
ncbi:hypothetical protein [Staphylococcus kloosii]|jgi:hypothetical protein|uniref:hypothetical protein n=1 Tax=Staphylococcus kloosii TaxID=29384 RepID=UPI00189E21C7|nr:hypothetical protein [Staphylococcus kloosii]MBF7025163.1 hypothetical protein [Staphylococcus kloosii]